MAVRRLRGKTGFFRQRRQLAPRDIAKDSIELVDVAARSHRGRLHVAPADENILPAVVVEICEVNAVAGHRSAEQGHSGLRGNFRESVLAFVLVNWKSFVVQGDEHDVRAAVVIEIAKVYA